VEAVLPVCVLNFRTGKCEEEQFQRVWTD